MDLHEANQRLAGGGDKAGPVTPQASQFSAAQTQEIADLKKTVDEQKKKLEELQTKYDEKNKAYEELEKKMKEVQEVSRVPFLLEQREYFSYLENFKEFV